MSSFGLIEENMELSHIHLTVMKIGKMKTIWLADWADWTSAQGE